MSALTPLVFRPSTAQRTLAALLFAGSWLAGVRGLSLLLQNVPRLWGALRAAEALGEPQAGLWFALILGLLAALAGGAVLLMALLGLLLIEGTQVIVDELGIAVELNALPGALARRLGAGRLTWKEVSTFEKGRCFFLLKGGGATPAPSGPVLRFLVVEHLERLVVKILESSPNLRFRE